jgi:hypothetical protein
MRAFFVRYAPDPDDPDRGPVVAAGYMDAIFVQREIDAGEKIVRTDFQVADLHEFEVRAGALVRKDGAQ